ncbi:DUF222 domain-containing protein, partial [Phytoactinopolyspora limicola]|uniref:DUF222 domain-containing protein n=1 Tax=Phytoactinopolyspora limicola TaxID=2715536 RepID=UPI00140A3AE7
DGEFQGYDPEYVHATITASLAADPGVGVGGLAGGFEALGDVPGVDESDIAGMLPGTRLAVVLDTLALAEVGVHQLADTVAGWERIIAWAAARQADAATELTRRDELSPDDDGARFASLHPVPVTAAALCAVRPWTKPQAEKLVDHAVTLVEDYPRVHHALRDGRLDMVKARILTRALTKCDTDVAELIQNAVLPFVHGWTDVKLSRVINELLHELDAAGAKRRHRQARDRRDVWLQPGDDGMAWLIAYLPAEEATAILTALNAAADHPHNPDPDHQPGPHSKQNPTRERDQTQEQARERDQTREQGRERGQTREQGRERGRDRRSRAQRRADALASFGWMSLTTGHLGGQVCVSCGSVAGARLAHTHGRPRHREHHRTDDHPARPRRTPRPPRRLRPHRRRHHPHPRRHRVLALGRHPPRRRTRPQLRHHPLHPTPRARGLRPPP